MALPSILGFTGAFLMEIQTNELLRTNEESKKYGLVLTPQDALDIIEGRNQVLQSYGRIELDGEVTAKLIRSFCTSSYINLEDYRETIKELQEIFYYMKNETEEEIGDDELIDIIKKFFEDSCKGSVELLQGRELEEYTREVRYNNQLREALL